MQCVEMVRGTLSTTRKAQLVRRHLDTSAEPTDNSDGIDVQSPVVHEAQQLHVDDKLRGIMAGGEAGCQDGIGGAGGINITRVKSTYPIENSFLQSSILPGVGQ